VEIERCRRLGADDAARFAAIYETSFAARERGDTAELLADVESGRRRCDVAREAGELIGFALALPLAGTGIAFLEFLAIDAERRNAGLGGRLLAHLQESLAASGTRGLVLEVEPPWAVDGTERELRERRVAFYERHGAAVVECAPAYRTPDLADAARRVPFTLLWSPLDAAAPRILEGEPLRQCVRAILTQSYELDPGDPLVDEVVAALDC
jgi:ribosomal protein S18 acetylase RimI-like enzyme